MLKDSGDTTMTGRFRWENAYCTRCKDRTTHWFLNDNTSKCAMCNMEKTKTVGLGLNLREQDEK